ncbi:MAG: hypothetical protein ACI9FG_002012, partial [Crocinitomicaceae bacterium]
SIIALGPKPARRYEMPSEYKNHQSSKSLNASSGGQAILLGAPKHSTPPAQLFYKLDENSKWARFNIRFNNQGILKKIPPLKTLNFFSSIPIDEGTKPALKISPLEPSSSTLIFLTPTGNQKSLWKNNPKFTIVPLTWSSTGGTRILLINTSRQVVNILFSDGRKLSLKSGSQTRIDLKDIPKKNKITIVAKGVRDSKIALQESIRNLPRITKVYAFYNAAPMTNGGRTLGSFRAVYEIPN